MSKSYLGLCPILAYSQFRCEDRILNPGCNSLQKFLLSMPLHLHIPSFSDGKDEGSRHTQLHPGSNLITLHCKVF